MRKIIIDTDCGSDDAVALMMLLKTNDVEVAAVTTVCGNVPLEQATKNALMTIEITGGSKPPLYVGSAKPLFRELVTATRVHGQDGMGDCGLIHPTIIPEKKPAVDAILELVEANPGEIEIITIGPVTNIAIAILKAPETMKKVKQIYSMGTAGFGRGNVTPVAEFNVYVDAEAYKVMLDAGIPITIIGFDICLGEAALTRADLAMLLDSGKPEAIFAARCNGRLLQYNVASSGEHIVDLPDAVAVGVALWDDIVLNSVPCFCYACIKEEPAYGQVILNDNSMLALNEEITLKRPNAVVCKTINNKLFKERLFDLLLS